jgi:hypothetical protein
MALDPKPVDLKLLDEFVGVLSTGGELGRIVRMLRKEWD